MTTTAPAAADPRPAVPTATNQVLVGGRLAADPVSRVLPSGDEVITFTVVVQRGPADRRPPSVDAIECAVWRAQPRRRVAGWEEGDLVEVEGALRRRFWRGPAGLASRYEVEVRKARRLRA